MKASDSSSSQAMQLEKKMSDMNNVDGELSKQV